MEVLDYFKQIVAIPHCSFETDEMRAYLNDFAKKQGATIKIDKVGNLHIIKGQPKICLQAHYDMVCVGLAPKIELIEKDGLLKAKDSSLGADNGMGLAICMDMLTKFDDLEILFTNNEEVGLVGAEGFNQPIQSKYLLNLDSENEKEIIIGCAGGVRMLVKFPLEFITKTQNAYEITVSGLPGGHSGSEINKNIPNALKVLNNVLYKNSCLIHEINGGERDNSIPANAKAIVLCDHEPKFEESKFIKVQSLGKKELEVIKNSDNIIKFMMSFSHGLRAYDENLKMVADSANLATIKQKDEIEFQIYARSMSKDGVLRLKDETIALANLAGAYVEVGEQTFPWEPVVSNFAKTIYKIMKKDIPDVEIKTIHAGLECGIICERQPHLEACSIGPNIHSPHGVNETCELASVERIAKIVEKLLEEINK